MTGLDTSGRDAGTSIDTGRATPRPGGRSASPAHRDAAVGDGHARRGHDCMVVILIVAPSGDWAGYVRAALEASMVGALADWFAVTALFRRPLGLPIPHTAIVVARKEQFGQTLAIFFRENFLSGAAVAERMRSSAAVARRVHLARRPRARDDDGPQRAPPQRGRARRSHERVVDTVVSELRAADGRRAPHRRCPQASCARRSRALSSTTASRRCAARLARHLRTWRPSRGVAHRGTSLVASRRPSSTDSSSTWSTGPSTRSTRSHGIPTIRPGDSSARRWSDSSTASSAIRRSATGCTIAAHRRRGSSRRRDAHRDGRRPGRPPADRGRNPGSQLEERLVDLITETAASVRDDPALHVRIERAIEATIDRAMARFGGDVDSLVTGTILVGRRTHRGPTGAAARPRPAVHPHQRRGRRCARRARDLRVGQLVG